MHKLSVKGFLQTCFVSSTLLALVYFVTPSSAQEKKGTHVRAVTPAPAVTNQNEASCSEDLKTETRTRLFRQTQYLKADFFKGKVKSFSEFSSAYRKLLLEAADDKAEIDYLAPKWKGSSKDPSQFSGNWESLQAKMKSEIHHQILFLLAEYAQTGKNQLCSGDLPETLWNFTPAKRLAVSQLKKAQKTSTKHTELLLLTMNPYTGEKDLLNAATTQEPDLLELLVRLENPSRSNPGETEKNALTGLNQFLAGTLGNPSYRKNLCTLLSQGNVSIADGRISFDRFPVGKLHYGSSEEQKVLKDALSAVFPTSFVNGLANPDRDSDKLCLSLAVVPTILSALSEEYPSSQRAYEQEVEKYGKNQEQFNRVHFTHQDWTAASPSYVKKHKAASADSTLSEFATLSRNSAQEMWAPSNGRVVDPRTNSCSPNNSITVDIPGGVTDNYASVFELLDTTYATQAQYFNQLAAERSQKYFSRTGASPLAKRDQALSRALGKFIAENLSAMILQYGGDQEKAHQALKTIGDAFIRKAIDLDIANNNRPGFVSLSADDVRTDIRSMIQALKLRQKAGNKSLEKNAASSVNAGEIACFNPRSGAEPVVLNAPIDLTSVALGQKTAKEIHDKQLTPEILAQDTWVRNPHYSDKDINNIVLESSDASLIARDECDNLMQTVSAELTPEEIAEFQKEIANIDKRYWARPSLEETLDSEIEQRHKDTKAAIAKAVQKHIASLVKRQPRNKAKLENFLKNYLSFVAGTTMMADDAREGENFLALSARDYNNKGSPEAINTKHKFYLLQKRSMLSMLSPESKASEGAKFQKHFSLLIQEQYVPAAKALQENDIAIMDDGTLDWSKTTQLKSPMTNESLLTAIAAFRNPNFVVQLAEGQSPVFDNGFVIPSDKMRADFSDQFPNGKAVTLDQFANWKQTQLAKWVGAPKDTNVVTPVNPAEFYADNAGKDGKELSLHQLLVGTETHTGNASGYIAALGEIIAWRKKEKVEAMPDPDQKADMKKWIEQGGGPDSQSARATLALTADRVKRLAENAYADGRQILEQLKSELAREEKALDAQIKSTSVSVGGGYGAGLYQTKRKEYLSQVRASLTPKMEQEVIRSIDEVIGRQTQGLEMASESRYGKSMTILATGVPALVTLPLTWSIAGTATIGNLALQGAGYGLAFHTAISAGASAWKTNRLDGSFLCNFGRESGGAEGFLTATLSGAVGGATFGSLGQAAALGAKGAQARLLANTLKGTSSVSGRVLNKVLPHAARYLGPAAGSVMNFLPSNFESCIKAWKEVWDNPNIAKDWVASKAANTNFWSECGKLAANGAFSFVDYFQTNAHLKNLPKDQVMVMDKQTNMLRLFNLNEANKFIGDKTGRYEAVGVERDGRGGLGFHQKWGKIVAKERGPSQPKTADATPGSNGDRLSGATPELVTLGLPAEVPVASDGPVAAMRDWVLKKSSLSMVKGASDSAVTEFLKKQPADADMIRRALDHTPSKKITGLKARNLKAIQKGLKNSLVNVEYKDPKTGATTTQTHFLGRPLIDLSMFDVTEQLGQIYTLTKPGVDGTPAPLSMKYFKHLETHPELYSVMPTDTHGMITQLLDAGLGSELKRLYRTTGKNGFDIAAMENLSKKRFGAIADKLDAWDKLNPEHKFKTPEARSEARGQFTDELLFQLDQRSDLVDSLAEMHRVLIDKGGEGFTDKSLETLLKDQTDPEIAQKAKDLGVTAEEIKTAHKNLEEAKKLVRAENPKATDGEIRALMEDRKQLARRFADVLMARCNDCPEYKALCAGWGSMLRVKRVAGR